jgi:hypothetical protein
MDKKLINDHNQYHLINKERFIIATTDTLLLKYSDKHKLSTKNCQTIENGYDLDELADKYRSNGSIIKHPDPNTNVFESGIYQGFRAGFKKALKILGDKKFSEGDIRKAAELSRDFKFGRDAMDYTTVEFQKSNSDIIQSLQQTEWNVEIKMDICGDKVYEVPEYAIDEEGCLILTRK